MRTGKSRPPMSPPCTRTGSTLERHGDGFSRTVDIGRDRGDLDPPGKVGAGKGAGVGLEESHRGGIGGFDQAGRGGDDDAILRRVKIAVA